MLSDTAAQLSNGVPMFLEQLTRTLLELAFTVDQVGHDYGDLCQAITDLAVERDAPSP